MIKAYIRYYFLALFTLTVVCPSFAAERTPIEKLASLPEDKIDIGIVALTLAKEFYPNLDVEAYSAKIDEMARNAKVLTRHSTDPDFRIRALNTYLYKVEGIQYDYSDPMGKKPENRFLNGILYTKKGSCVTMPLLYLAIAQRMGYPVYPVSAPEHFFLRYVDKSLKLQNIEATSGGGSPPDENYKETLQISERGIKSGAYLKNMTYREFLGELIAQNGFYHWMNGNYALGIRYLNIAAKLNPYGAEIHDLLGKMYLILSESIEDLEESLDIQVKGVEAMSKAGRLGLVKLDDTNYLMEVKKKQELSANVNPAEGRKK